MENEEFQTTADEFMAWVNALQSTASGMLEQARRLLRTNGRQSQSMQNDEAAELALRAVSKRIEDVMSSFDSVLKSMRLPPRYKAFFDSLDSADKAEDH